MEDDPAAILAWYDDAAGAAYEERSLRSCDVRPLTLEVALARPDSDEPIGLLGYTVSGGWLAVRFIALAKAHRGWGYGSEAVRLLEEWVVQEGLAERIWAEVPVAIGLGLYFWLRLGYRPEGPHDARGWRTERERDRMRMVRCANR